MPVVFCGVCPHPPVMVPEVGKKQSDIVIKSRRAMLELGRRLKESGTESMVMISPHGPVFRDGIAINMAPVLKGDLGSFGAPGISFELESDLDLASAVSRAARDAGIMTVGLEKSGARRYGVSLELDHGLTVPLYFLAGAGVRLPAAVVYMGLLPFDQLYGFGMAVREAVEESGKKVAVIASGDLSHRLTRDAPAGYDPMGEEFDREMVRLLNAADAAGVMNLDPELVERAGECGLRPVIMMLGTLDGQAVEAEVLSYEGPFGVGYLVAALRPGSADPGRLYSRDLAEKRRAGAAAKKKNEGYLPGIARAALEHYSRGEKFTVPPDRIPVEFRKPAGVFVSLKKHGQLRGCIGTVSPQYGNIVEETINNAVSAGHRDPRFYPVRDEELDELDISVDVLHAPEPVKSKDDLDPVRYGVIVKSGRRQGLLLPNLEGVNTVEEQIDIARQKAGIGPGEPYELERFEVVRYK
ncbi:MAG: AmmeMemoRadiSam system protein A [Peptococcaceae bacterium]|nr:AmmeMemoRadiSam system protein A [Peptococcaceae bacterium]